MAIKCSYTSNTRIRIYIFRVDQVEEECRNPVLEVSLARSYTNRHIRNTNSIFEANWCLPDKQRKINNRKREEVGAKKKEWCCWIKTSMWPKRNNPVLVDDAFIFGYSCPCTRWHSYWNNLFRSLKSKSVKKWLLRLLPFVKMIFIKWLIFHHYLHRIRHKLLLTSKPPGQVLTWTYVMLLIKSRPAEHVASLRNKLTNTHLLWLCVSHAQSNEDCSSLVVVERVPCVNK